MIQLILIIVGIVYWARLPSIKSRTAEMYPGTDPEKFSVWHQADVKATVAFVWASLGGAVLTLIVSLLGGALAVAARLDQDTAMIAILGAVLIAFLAPLAWAASLGSQAGRLKKDAGIR